MKTIFLLAFKSLANRRTSTVLTVVAIGLSMSLLLVVERLRTGAREGFTGVISQTDVIAGARSGPVQLLMYSVFQIGSGSNNISPGTWKHFQNHQSVAWTIPVALGDSHRGFPVIATNQDMFTYYRYRKGKGLAFTSGSAPSSRQDVALGASVARELGYGIGSEIILAHGLAKESFVTHNDKPFRVSGILEPTGTPYDRNLFIQLEAMAGLHGSSEHSPDNEDHHHHGHDKHQDHDEQHEAAEDSGDDLPGLAAFFIGTKSRTDALALQREIQEYKGEPMTAALPGLTLAQLWSGLSYAEGVLQLISMLVIVVGLLSMIVALYNSLQERRREMAILRALGARPWLIIAMLLAESAMVTGMAITLGLAVTYGIIVTAADVIGSRFGIHLPVTGLSLEETWRLAAMFMVALLMAAAPARKAYRNALVDGLTIRI